MLAVTLGTSPRSPWGKGESGSLVSELFTLLLVCICTGMSPCMSPFPSWRCLVVSAAGRSRYTHITPHKHEHSGQLWSLVVFVSRLTTEISSTHLLWLASSRAWLASLREVSSMPTGRVALQRPQEQVLMAYLPQHWQLLVITFNYPSLNKRQWQSHHRLSKWTLGKNFGRAVFEQLSIPRLLVCALSTFIENLHELICYHQIISQDKISKQEQELVSSGWIIWSNNVFWKLVTFRAETFSYD